MPKNPTLEQRVQWHTEHAKNCSCRPFPENLLSKTKRSVEATNINKDSADRLTVIPGVGKSIAKDLNNIGITSVKDLKRKNPEALYELSNKYAGITQDRCLLYELRCAVYFANGGRNPAKLKWWNWKD
jgi:predicted flap endonuclease-1-like 5' DNA nuclease